jgi:hypothetical protein
MTENIVPVKVWLAPDTYRELLGHARLRGFEDVGSLVGALAHASLRKSAPAPALEVEQATRRPRGRTRYTDKMLAELADLRADNVSWRACAEVLGGTASGLQRAWQAEQRKNKP